METYRTAAQVARMFRVGTPTVRRYIRSGELPAARVGRSFVISGADIDGFVVAHKTTRQEKGSDSYYKGRASRKPRSRRR